MADKKKILLVGESWMTSAVHYKGWDHFGSTTFHLGAEPLVEALKDSDFALTYMPAHEAAADFPMDMAGLQAYDAIIVSDIGANTILLHPDVWLHSKRIPNRLKLIREYVNTGGGLLKVGGYLSFQGINGSARYRGTPVADVLPVDIYPYDDRLELPEGFQPQIVGNKDHPILAGLGSDWPPLLGINEVTLKPAGDADLLAKLPDDEGGHPLLVTGSHGRGRVVAWTSDIGPHWLPPEFAEWSGYARLWRQILAWLTAPR